MKRSSHMSLIDIVANLVCNLGITVSQVLCLLGL